MFVLTFSESHRKDIRVNKKREQSLTDEVLELDQGWEDYLQKVMAQGLGLTLEQYKVFETLTGEEAAEYLKKHSVN